MDQEAFLTSTVFAISALIIDILYEESNLTHHNLKATVAKNVTNNYLQSKKENFFMLPKDTGNSIDQVIPMLKKCPTPLSSATN